MSLVLACQRVRKEHGGLRPLRLADLRVGTGERLAVLGLDAGAAEALMHLVTGATRPDEGVVRLFGEDTSAVADANVWLATLDRFGLVSPRAVLIDVMTVAQNLAMAFTLSVDPIPDDVLERVRSLAVEAGVPLAELDRPVRETPSSTLARLHLARALAADPAVLLIEHANVLTGPADAAAFGRDIARVAEGRGVALLAATADEVFARAVAARVLTLDPATGRLAAAGGWRGWFR